MSSTIKIKRSSTQSAVPGSLEVGEIAVNLFDRKLYVGNTTGVTAVGGEDFRLTSSAPADNDDAYVRLIGAYAASANNVLLNPGEGIDITLEANGSILIAGEDASDTNKGVASFDSGDFSVTSGAVALADSATGAVIAINGTANEVDVSRTNGTVTVGLPDNVTVAGTLDVTSATNINDTTGSTSTTTGALIVDGGAGIAENLYVGGDTNILGNLTVTGGTTYISSSTVTTDDSMVKLSANNSADTVDSGVYSLYIDGVTSKYAGYFRDTDDGVFKFYKELESEPSTTVDTGGTGYALAQVDCIIDGGSY